MVSDKNLNKFIDKLHLRSSNKIWRHVVKEYGDVVSKEQLGREDQKILNGLKRLRELKREY